MILPIVAYGHPVLRKVAQDIDADYPFLEKLIQDMGEIFRRSMIRVVMIDCPANRRCEQRVSDSLRERNCF